MEVPILARPITGNTPPEMEVISTADSFCDAFNDVATLMRHSLLAAQHQLGFDASDFDAMDRVLQSQPMQSHIELAVQNGNYPPLINDGVMLGQIIEMARTVILGREIERYKHAGHHIPKEYLQRVVEMNNLLVEFTDSELASTSGFGRRHLKRLVAIALNLSVNHPMVESLERGLAVEIGTKKALEQLGKKYGMSVEWSSVEEDLHKVDLICTQGQKKLHIQVKSRDNTAGDITERRAAYTQLEEYDLHEYRVRELSPAVATAVGEQFDIKAPRYTQVLERMLEDFNARS